MSTCSDEETLKMLVDQPASWRTSEPGCKALGAVGGLNLDTERAQDVDSPAGPRSSILFPSCHWS